MRARASIRSSCSSALSILLLGLCVVGIAFVLPHLAIANISMDAPIKGYVGGDSDYADHVDAPEMPTPVVGDKLFVVRSGATVCVSREAVIAKFLEDESEIGGRTFTIADGLDQRFSDLWRERAGVQRIAISGIVTHLFSDRDADEWTADVVEIGTAGCAISRTLLPGHALQELFATLARRSGKFGAGDEVSNVDHLPDIRSERTFRKLRGGLLQRQVYASSTCRCPITPGLSDVEQDV